MSNVDNLSGLEFEKYIAWLLGRKGYQEVEITKGSGDFGVDIVASFGGSKYAIQVKRYSSNVSRRAVSDAVAGKGHYFCSEAMVITNSHFTKQAKIFAESVNCVLVDRDILISWIMECYSEDRNYIEPIGAINTTIPDDVMEQICKYAKETWPDSIHLQQTDIEINVEAYNKISRIKDRGNNKIPKKVWNFIIQSAKEDSHGDFSIELENLQNNIKWWENELNLKEAPQSVINNIFNYFYDDKYETLFSKRYSIEREAEGYHLLKELKKSRSLPRIEFNKLYAKAQRENPKSYRGTYNDLKTSLDNYK
ncbi:hypothetical protein DGMP_01570 [Desulfomarina profundi]|uniref:Restriction endonuclease type IV Mrr domain-containing protein n=1 Tax=Desulfomarina profundi TaxID=2772557 RepID=A0A8D5JG06_9BACT|nr:hypothetical protein DGMP_01570 [Desulfomarina profundi]